MNQINVGASGRSNGRAIKAVVWAAISLTVIVLAGLWFGNVYQNSFSNTAIAATRAAETCGMSRQTFDVLPLALQSELKDQCSQSPTVGP